MVFINPLYIVSAIVFAFIGDVSTEENSRRKVSLNEGWYTTAGDEPDLYTGFERADYDVSTWDRVNVPHNWDQYEGYRRLIHGNRHGSAWYRRGFEVEKPAGDRQYFLWFEGVGSYATVWLNGEQVGYHAGGRTSFTIDITDALLFDEENILAVRADHPAHISDLPWVCGGCSSEVGFSEGSQPMGIFRPVHLIATNKIRIEPFGVHVWNDTTATGSSADVFVRTEIKNYGEEAQKITLSTRLVGNGNEVVAISERKLEIGAGQTITAKADLPKIRNVNLWSPSDPHLYQVVTEIRQGNRIVDAEKTPFGIRTVKWDIGSHGTSQLLINNEPVFINGTCEYEHMMGMSHAFSDEQIKTRVMQIRAAGFNAFRDAHQPHNLRYHPNWDSLGMVWWTQMAAHIWFDSPDFKDNFKNLLREWVKERRNSPSLVLWGLENESTLPEEFARECTEIIREMDPTTSSQRLVTTCNGGSGTDWNVPQNWTGTYGGNPDTYDKDVQRQQLIGEYGAWRTLDLHTEGPFDQDGIYSEDRMALLTEKKVRLAESAKDSTSGHFQWIFTSHENPGRNQSGEAYRELDRVGPVNYKGLLTPWGEPADVFYMYRSNYAPKETEPMVYIVSHTWPNRWSGPGVKDSIVVYSNCDEVELFNGVKTRSFGRKKNEGIGTHFQWDQVEVESNLLYAVGYVDGQEVARDYILLNHLPQATDFQKLTGGEEVVKSADELNYIYRVNCGGADFTDHEGNVWLADVHLTSSKSWGSLSWTDSFEDLPPFFASQRRTFDPIANTRNQELFRTFRYGKHELQYHFPLPDGEYSVQLYFVEPWYGTGGGMDCTDWRNFDIAVNGKVVLDDLDIWKAAGHDRALVKSVQSTVQGGKMVISFLEVKSGQAVISAIAITSEDKKIKPAPSSESLIRQSAKTPNWKQKSWLDIGHSQTADGKNQFKTLPPELFGAEYLQIRNPEDPVVFKLSQEADVHVAIHTEVKKPVWLKDFDDADSYLTISDGNQSKTLRIYRKRFGKGMEARLCADKGAGDYSVFVTPATEIEPPYDLKPKIQFKSVQGEIIGENVTREMKYGLDCASFKSTSGDTLQWQINPGVADYHAFHVKFSNETGGSRTVYFRLVANDGLVMLSEVVELRETPEGKYREVTVKTPSMINAGNYQVEVASEDARGVCIRGFTMQ